VNHKAQIGILVFVCLAMAFLAGCGSTPTTPVYSYSVSGLEMSNPQGSGPYYYAIAGSVAIDNQGNVVGGEQDFNDGAGNTSPGDAGATPTPDTIQATKAALVLTNGQGTLTLTTNNPNIGVNGVETFGVQFVNQKHALIVQYDGTATSSGSLDLQTLPNQLNGSYAFAMNGMDPDYEPVAFGGVFTTGSNGSTFSGVYDENDAENGVSTGNLFPQGVAISAPDSYGRGYITGLGEGVPTSIVYYVVGAEVARLIDVDTTDAGLGSAFGQGSTTYSNTSLTSSVFALQSNSHGNLYAAAGQITSPAGGVYQSGIADEDEQGYVQSGVSISGTYSISNAVNESTYNGYGNLQILSEDEDFNIANLGVYVTDPSLNLSDPNNSTGGGGALIVDLDDAIPGTGIMVPQTDTTTANFTGSYAYGAQEYFCDFCEFDVAGQATMTAGTFNGSGLISAPDGFVFEEDGTAIESTATLTGNPLPDSNESTTGRYTLMTENETENPLILTVAQDPIDFDVVIYQASGGQLFWLNEDDYSIFLGPIQQQGSLTSLP
jgi:hypothetical protein